MECESLYGKRAGALIRRNRRKLLTTGMFAAFLWSLASVDWSKGLVHDGGGAIFAQMISALLRPDLSGGGISLALQASWITFAYAVCGMSLAILIGLTGGVIASGVLCESPAVSFVSRAVSRAGLGIMRSVHELIWAWLFVAAVGLRPEVAVFAIAIPYGGSLGRVYADILRDVKKEPVTALRAAGANTFQTLIYAYIPMALSDMISYTLYRFECAVRSSAILSFVGVVGIGYQIQMALQDMDFPRAFLFLFALVAMVVAVDQWSSVIRKQLIK